MRLVVSLAVVVTVLTFATPALSAERYCGTSVRRSVTSVTYYVAAAWDRPGWRQMMTRRLWSDTASWYVCRPVAR